MNIPEKLLGFTVVHGEKPNLDNYPLFYDLENEIEAGAIGSINCLFICPKTSLKLPVLLKMVTRLQAELGKPCVIITPSLSKYQTERLVEENVAWINSDTSFFLPFLGLSLRNLNSKQTHPKPLSAQAQKIAINIINGLWAGKSTSDIAGLLNKSLASTSNYFKEIELIAPKTILSQGRKRFINPLCKALAPDLLSTFEPYLSSPVESSFYLKFKDAGFAFPKDKYSYSGITALSKKTMLGDNLWTTYAASCSPRSFLDCFTGKVDIVDIEDGPDALVEFFKYSIDSQDECIDDISLYLSFKDYDKNDPRLEEALETLLERI